MVNQTRKISALVIMLVLAFLSFSVYFSMATPSGAEISGNVTASAVATTPANRSDDGGTITTMVLNTLQQVGSWKGYVGNVTGQLSLDDANSFTIYDWDLTGVTITGEVYSTRASSPVWSNVSCATAANLITEETFHNMTAADADSITNTFNYTLHDQFVVGSLSGSTTIVNSTCPSTATYVNDTRQSMANESVTYFQEVVLNDSSANVIFTTLIEDDYDSYRTVSNSSFDFQMIVPESDLKAAATTYYFFLEIG